MFKEFIFILLSILVYQKNTLPEQICHHSTEKYQNEHLKNVLYRPIRYFNSLFLI